ncbi:hypothetical protein Q7I36_10455, partial [Aeromonas veronii]|uniref:hypothetical protein n=1 Tax=Aeromonas veronii TaxID=654 RepID=UPI003004D64B
MPGRFVGAFIQGHFRPEIADTKKPKRVTAWAFSLNMAEEVPAVIKSNQLHTNPASHLLSV